MSKSKPYPPAFFARIILVLCLFAYANLRSQCSIGLFATNAPLNCMTSTTSGTASVVSGGTPPFTYTWLPTGGNASVAIGLVPNSYTILVADGFGGCGSTQLVILNNTGINVNMSPFAVTCFGGNDGSIITSVTGSPTYPLSYSWTPTAPNSGTIINITAGIYSVVVTDASNCKFTATTQVTQPLPYTSTLSTKPINCNGALSSATMGVSGGTPPYTYSWSPTVSTNSVINNIAAGTYSATVNDANGCVISQSVTITQPAAFTATLNITNVTCNNSNNGQVTAALGGGTPAYSYTWLPGGTNGTGLNNLSPGSYTLLAKDSKSCSLSQPFNITQPAALTYTTSHTDEFCVNSDGTATVFMSGGTSPYTYTWTTLSPQNTATATGLAAGTYSCFVTDANGCNTTAIVTVGNLSNLVGKILSKADASCNGNCNGTANAGISGGSAPYTYTWVTIAGANTANVTNLCAGTYSVKITDNLGCYTFTTVTINEPLPITYTITGQNKICVGRSSTLTANANGGTAPYSYTWQPGSITSSLVTVSPTTTTSYSVTIKDANGCSIAPKIYSVTVNAPLSLISGANSLTVCPGVNTPITAQVIGGDGSYLYNWQPGNFNTSNINVNLNSSAVYTLTINDGCGSIPITNTIGITVYTTTTPNFTVSINKGCEPLCVQFTNTTPSVTTCFWNFGDFSNPVVSPATTHCYSKAGSYAINLVTTDAKGCKASLVYTNCINVLASPKADFIYTPEKVDLNNPEVEFKNTSVNASNVYWKLDGVPMGTKSKWFYKFPDDVACYSIKIFASNQAFCTDSTEQQICVTEGFNFWMPNAFTPDEDEMNEIFIPKGTYWSEDNYSFAVYDRWGTIAFKTSSIYQGWNGKVGGIKATDEVYVWKVHILDKDGNKHDYYGKVALLR